MRHVILSTLGVLGLTVGASASTFTLNDADAFCVSGTCTNQVTRSGLNITNMLGVGAVYGLTDPSFIDGNGDTYAARVTVLGVNGTSLLDRDGDPVVNYSSINVSSTNAWIHYGLEFVESFDPASRQFGADTTVANVQFVNIEDIDSNNGDNFTDVAAVNLPVIGRGSALEEGGFLPESETGIAPPAVGSEFNFVRLSQNGDGSWATEGNVRADAPDDAKASITASFGTPGQDLAGFEFIWGSTGSFYSNRVRGWDLTIAADPVVGTPPPELAPVPLPASALFLLAGIGGLAFMRRRATA